ncbi:GD24818 [Drosophila simulans]|uniref:GD24818 n=1 Tax=Drosophila simulans TaxID=7240 RepID=B4NUG8_DROSI|nr:GD24818 [Drosophila simulans]
MSSGTAGCKRAHSIEVEQPLASERLEHSLLLVKGRLVPKCSTARQLKAILDLPEHLSQEQLTQLSAGGEFKLLFDLEQANREEEEEEESACLLELRSCTATRTISFSYRPRRSSYRVQPLYLLCQDEEKTPAQQHEVHSLIDLNMRLVQSIYAHKLHAAGFPNRTFTLNGKCCAFRSQLTRKQALAKSEDELWHHFAGEIIACPQWGHQLLLKFVAFVGCTRYNGDAVVASGDSSYASIRRHLKGHAALGGGGLALFGSAHFLRVAHDLRGKSATVCAAQSKKTSPACRTRATIGGRTAAEGVMGQGFDYLNRVLTVDQPTEHLPQRIVDARRGSPANTNSSEGGSSSTSTSSASAAAGNRGRLTKLKLQPSSQLLDNYHNQRRHDSFYFARNCAVILAHHRWLNLELEQTAAADFEAASIQLNRDTREIRSSRPIRLVELRCNQNSLVAHYEEFEQPSVHRFQLPASLWHLLAEQCTHYVFVLTTSGDTKRLSCDSS